MAEGRYTRIKSRFWVDEKVLGWSEETKLLALYLLTSPHNNMLGCYVLPKLYICEDLGWEPQRVAGPFTRLIDDGFIKYDAQSRLVFLLNYLKHNPLENGNRAEAAIKFLNELPKSSLFTDLKAAVERQCKPYLQHLAEALSNQVPKPIGKQLKQPFANQLDKSLGEPYSKPLLEPLGEVNGKHTNTNTDTDTETKTKTDADAKTNIETNTITTTNKILTPTENASITPMSLLKTSSRSNIGPAVNKNITTVTDPSYADLAVNAEPTVINNLCAPGVPGVREPPAVYGQLEAMGEHANAAPGNPAKSARGKTYGGNDGYIQDFEYFWSVYPRRIEKRVAYKAWQARVKEGAAPRSLIIAAQNYAVSCRENGTEPRFIKHPRTFLGSGKPYEDYMAGPLLSRPEISREPKGFAVLREFMSDLQKEGKLQ